MARVRPLRGSLGVAFVALSHRDERLLRHAREPEAPRPPDGSGPRRCAGRREPAHPGPALDRADAGRARRPGRGSGRDRRRARVRSPRIRCGAPAASGAPARRSHPLRGAALEGRGGRRAPRDERRVREQRPATGAGHARGERRDAGDDVAFGRFSRRRAPAALRHRVRAVRHGRPDVADPRGRHAVDASVRPLARRARRHPQLVVRPREHLPGLACRSGGGGQRRAGVRPVQAEAGWGRLRAVGVAGAWRSRTAGSSSSLSSSTSRPSSRASDCRSSTTPPERGGLTRRRSRRRSPRHPVRFG